MSVTKARYLLAISFLAIFTFAVLDAIHLSESHNMYASPEIPNNFSTNTKRLDKYYAITYTNLDGELECVVINTIHSNRGVGISCDWDSFRKLKEDL